jgi:hypothetical protein
MMAIAVYDELKGCICLMSRRFLKLKICKKKKQRFMFCGVKTRIKGILSPKAIYNMSRTLVTKIKEYDLIKYKVHFFESKYKVHEYILHASIGVEEGGKPQ